MQINSWQIFTEKGHSFYIQPSWHLNKQTAKFYREDTSFFTLMVFKGRSCKNFADKGHLFYINCMQINRWQHFSD